MTFLDSISALSPYSLPAASIEAIGLELGIGADDDVSSVDPKLLNGAKARLFLFLATTPNVSEGGVSISFSAYERALFLGRARRYAELAGDTGLVPGAAYGYRGENI